MESKIEERTTKIKVQNEKLRKYVFDVRGSLVLILELFYLRKLDKNGLSDSDIIKKAQYESEQMDRTVKQISVDLESQIDQLENPKSAE